MTLTTLISKMKPFLRNDYYCTIFWKVNKSWYAQPLPLIDGLIDPHDFPYVTRALQVDKKATLLYGWETKEMTLKDVALCLKRNRTF